MNMAKAAILHARAIFLASAVTRAPARWMSRRMTSPGDIVPDVRAPCPRGTRVLPGAPVAELLAGTRSMGLWGATVVAVCVLQPLRRETRNENPTANQASAAPASYPRWLVWASLLLGAAGVALGLWSWLK